MASKIMDMQLGDSVEISKFITKKEVQQARYFGRIAFFLQLLSFYGNSPVSVLHRLGCWDQHSESAWDTAKTKLGFPGSLQLANRESSSPHSGAKPPFVGFRLVPVSPSR